LVRHLSIGANYNLFAFITLTVTNEDDEVVLTDVSASMDYWGWDDAYAVMPKGNAENNLFMYYVNNLQLGDDVSETWTLNVSDESAGKFASYVFADQIKGDEDRASEARLVGYFPIKTGAVTFSVTYDAYEGSGEDRLHIYHGQTAERTVRIVAEVASGDFRLEGTPVTYFADAEGFVHIDAWQAVSVDYNLSEYTVRNDFYMLEGPEGDYDFYLVNDAGEEDWEHATGCDIRIDPAQTGVYTVGQHTWVSLPDTDLWADTAFRVVVGSATGAKLTLYENSIDLSVINMRDTVTNISDKYFWVDGAAGETLTWKLTRTKGTSVDLAILTADDKWGATCTRVLNTALDNSGNIVHITKLNGVGQSTFELSATLTTISGKVLTAKKVFTVTVVDQPDANFLPTLTAPQQVFIAEAGQTVEIPQPTITWPAGVSGVKFQRLWFWSKGDKMSGYTYDLSATVRNVVLCPMEAGHYTVNFEVVRGASIADIVYTLIVNEPGEDAPEPVPQMHVVNYTVKDGDYYDTDGDGLIEIACQMDGGVNTWSLAGEFSMWGMTQEQIEGLTFALDAPAATGAMQASISKRLGDCTVFAARYTKEIGSPVTYTIRALIGGVDTGKRVEVTLMPPRVPQKLEGLDRLTLSTGMTYQLDLDALGSALGVDVTAFSCDYSGKTATDKRFTVSNTGLITVTANVGTAYVYAETADPATLAVIEVTVTAAPTSLTANPAALAFTDLPETQSIQVSAKVGEASVPAAITVSGNNPAVCSWTFEGVDEATHTYSYQITSVGTGSTSITFKAMGATLTVPVTVTRALTGVTLTAPETILAGTSGTVTAAFEPADASNKTLIWSTVFAEGQDITGFNNAWITMNNGVITVSKALDRVTAIKAVARWTLDGVEQTASIALTLVPLVTGVAIVPVGDGLTLIGTQYVCDLGSYDPLSPYGFVAHLMPVSLETTDNAPMIKWASSVATVASVSADGVITPLKPGTTNITATAMDGSKKSKTVTLVVRKYVTDMTLNSAAGRTLVAGSGAKLTLTATVQPLDATLRTVTWQSSNPALLSVHPTTGVVTAVKGTTVAEATEVTITATAADGSQAQGTITLTVVPKATAVTITGIGGIVVAEATPPIDLEMQAFMDGDGNIAPLALTGTVTPEDGLPLLWTSSNAAAASVSYDASGNAFLTLRKTATRVTLTAAAGSNSAAKSTVLVNIKNSGVVAPVKVTVTGASALAVGASATYQAVVEPIAANNKTVTWQLCDDAGAPLAYPGIATLSSGGVLKAGVVTGTALPTDVFVKAIANGAEEVESDPFRVALYPKATAVTLTGPLDSLIEGQQAHFIDIGLSPLSLTLTAAVSPVNARQAVAFSTSNAKVLTVQASETVPCQCTVTGVGVGTAKITATALDGSKRKAEYTITVGVITEDISISAPVSEIVAGSKLALSVERTPALVTNPALTWTSSNAAVATVSSAGLVTAKNVRTGSQVTITASAVDRPGLSASVTLLVRPKASGVTLYDSEDNPLTAKSVLNLTLYDDELDETQLSAVVTPYSAEDSTACAFQQVTYASANAKVATVDADTGLVLANGAGTTKITATATDGSKRSASVNVTVTCVPTGITVSGPDGVAVGKSVTLSATVLPEGVAKQPITWAVLAGGPKVTVSKTGVVSVKAGTATGTHIVVKATLANYPLIGYIREMVTTTPVASVPTNYGTGAKTLKVPLYQGSMQISATCLPATALQQLAYSSSNVKVATVDENGSVTFLSTGTAKITITAVDGSNAKTVITVNVTK
jgi:uncharacterized protein YjdB